MIDTVFFDLDNTIFDFNKAEHIALAKTLEELGIPPSEETCARYSVSAPGISVMSYAAHGIPCP